jgi:hypothetical protein
MNKTLQRTNPKEKISKAKDLLFCPAGCLSSFFLCGLCDLCGEIFYLKEVRALRAMTILWISDVPAEAIRISASR